jgi:hypothetical protein
LPVADWRGFDAGHFVSAGSGGFARLIDKRNVNRECQHDNAFNQKGLMLDMALEQQTRLRKRSCDSHF